MAMGTHLGCAYYEMLGEFSPHQDPSRVLLGVVVPGIVRDRFLDFLICKLCGGETPMEL
jgi:hypothetical protein